MAVSGKFSLEIEVKPDDIDGLNHVSNVVYLRWVLDVALEHSNAVGYPFTAYRDLGASFVVRRHEIDYIRPAYLGDRIRVTTWVESWKQVSSVRHTRICRITPAPEAERARQSGETGEGGEIELARASTLWAFIDLGSGRPQRIPEELRAAFFDPLAVSDL